MTYSSDRSGNVTAGPFPYGMNNKLKDHSLPEGTARNIVNADVDNSGRVSRRKGLATRVYAGVNLRDGYSCPSGIYFIEGPNLSKLNTNNTATILYSGISGTEFAFDYNDSTVYFSDGVVNLKIIDDVVYTWGLPVPDSFTLHSTGGSLGEGTYLAAICWVDSNGVESGASPLVMTTCTKDSGVVFSNLPRINSSQVAYKRLYLSTSNGKELYHVTDLSPGSSSYSVLTKNYDNGNILSNHFVSPAPPGHIICFYKGRAYIATEYGVFYSEPFSFDQFKIAENFLQFPSLVDIMLPTDDGIYFAYGNSTDFYAGTPEDGFNISNKFDYGGIRGTGKRIINSDDVIWQSQRGTVIGSPSGSCTNIQEANVATETADSGASLVKEQDGLKQFIVSLNNPTTSSLAANSWIDAEIIRRS